MTYKYTDDEEATAIVDLVGYTVVNEALAASIVKA